MSAAILTLADGSTHEILSGSLGLPVRGLWYARLEVDADEAITGAATITLARDNNAGADTFKGTITESAAFGGRATVAIVAGAGKLEGEIAPRNYEASPKSVLVDVLVRDALNELGETPATTIDLAGRVAPRWLRAQASGSATLDTIADTFALSWRALADGTIWIGEETWPESTPADALQQGDAASPLRAELAHAAATIAPGTTVLGKRVVEVCYSMGETSRATLVYDGESYRGQLSAMIRELSPPLIYRETHGATVRAQHADDSIDLEVDDPRIGVITAVPLRVGIPGARVLVDDGARVRLAFEAGAPSAPFALAIDADPDASSGVARVGDYCGRLAFDPTNLTLYYSPSLVLPYIPVAATLGPPAPLFPGTPIAIATGSGKVMLR